MLVSKQVAALVLNGIYRPLLPLVILFRVLLISLLRHAPAIRLQVDYLAAIGTNDNGVLGVFGAGSTNL